KLCPRRLGWVEFGDGVAGEGGSSPSPAQLCISLPRQRHTVGVIATQAMRSVAQAERAVQMLVGDDVTAGEGGAPAHRFNLQFAIQEADGIVTVYRAL